MSEYSAMRREEYVPGPEKPQPGIYTVDNFSLAKKAELYQSLGFKSPDPISQREIAWEKFHTNPGVVQHDLKRGDDIVIHVTEEDIRGGSQGRTDDCAIVRALRRLTGYFEWKVPGDSAYLMELGLGFRLPFSAVAFIREWDCGLITAPFSFEARLVPIGHLGGLCDQLPEAQALMEPVSVPF